MLKEKLDEIEAKVDSEKEWWEKRRATIQRDFPQQSVPEVATEAELPAASAAPEVVVTGVDSPAKSSAVTSDDEAVLVDAGTPIGSAPSSAPSTPSGKKKKGSKK